MEQHWDHFPVKRGFDSVQDIFQIIGDRGYIAGSYAAFMAAPYDTPILPNDIDVFATSEANAAAIAKTLDGGSRYGMDENAVAYSIRRFGGKLSIQVVKPHPDWKIFPDDIMGSFDLDISRAVLISPDIVMADTNVGLRAGKVLRINNPLRSLKRVLKYHQRGVEFNDHELLKLFQAWDAMPQEKKTAEIERAHDAAFPPDFGPDGDSGGWYSDDDYFDGE